MIPQLNSEFELLVYEICLFSEKYYQLIEQKDIYKNCLEQSFNQPHIQIMGQNIFQKYLQDDNIKKSFEREFAYYKGKIDYFDPDFVGKINIHQFQNNIQFILHLDVFKQLLYLRVLIIIMKKVVRFIALLQFIFGKIFNDRIQFHVKLLFRYESNQLKEFDLEDQTNLKIFDNILLDYRFQKSLKMKKEEDI